MIPSLFSENKSTLKNREHKKEIASIESSIPKKEEVQEKTALLSEAIELLKDEDIDAKSKNQFLKSIVDKIYFSRENSAEFILDIELL